LEAGKSESIRFCVQFQKNQRQELFIATRE